MPVAETSKQAYHEIKAEGLLAESEQNVLSVFRPGDRLTNREVSRITGMETSSVSARANKLTDMGYLEIDGRKTDPVTGKSGAARVLGPAATQQMGLI